MVQQMLTKGTVMAEEYRLQLADRMPMAAEAMEKATGLTGRALLDMMKKGKLISSEVLPKFGKELRKMAQRNDALNKTLNTNRVAQSRMTTAYQKFMNIIFKSGFGSALTRLFNRITDFLSESEGLGLFLGRVFNQLFNAVTGAFTVLKIPFTALSKIFESISFLFEGVDKRLVHFGNVTVPKVVGALAAMALMATKLGRKFFVITAALVAIRATIEEIIGLTTKGVVASIERKLGVDLDTSNLGEVAKNVALGGKASESSFKEIAINQLARTAGVFGQATGISQAQSIIFNNTKMTVTSTADLKQQISAATIPRGL